MGCGKSKHDVVTGNTTTIRKPSEAESVKGKESETIKRQGSCRCRKTNDISAAVSNDQPETTVENITKKPEENEAGGDCGEKKAEETNGGLKPEEKEPTTSPPVTAIMPENVVTEEKEPTTSPPVTAIVPDNVVTVEKEPTTSPPVTEIVPDNVVTEEKEPTTSPPETAIVPDNVVTEETVNEMNQSVLPIDEQTEKIDIETMVVEEDKSVEGKNEGDVDIEVPHPEVEEPKSDVQTLVTTELEVEETPTTTENDEIAVTETDEIPVKEEDKVNAEEENSANITKEAESLA